MEKRFDALHGSRSATCSSPSCRVFICIVAAPSRKREAVVSCFARETVVRVLSIDAGVAEARDEYLKHKNKEQQLLKLKERRRRQGGFWGQIRSLGWAKELLEKAAFLRSEAEAADTEKKGSHRN